MPPNKLMTLCVRRRWQSSVPSWRSGVTSWGRPTGRWRTSERPWTAAGASRRRMPRRQQRGWSQLWMKSVNYQPRLTCSSLSMMRLLLTMRRRNIETLHHQALDHHHLLDHQDTDTVITRPTLIINTGCSGKICCVEQLYSWSQSDDVWSDKNDELSEIHQQLDQS